MPCPWADSWSRAELRSFVSSLEGDISVGRFSTVLPQPQEMAGRTGKYPRGPRRLTAGLCQRSRRRERAPGTSGLRVLYRGRFRSSTWCSGRGELMGASDSENRGPLCGI